MGSIENKVAIITGAALGIGKSTALLFAREGAKVVVSDVNEVDGRSVVDEITRNGGEAFFVNADSSKAEDNEKLVNEAIRRFGALDIAINNAGIAGPICETGEYPLDGWDRVIATNLTGVFYGLRYQIPAMLEKGGSIVNISSILGMVGTRNSPAYTAAKHGVVGLTRATALEYANRKIRINAVGPGYIKTPMVMNALNEESIKAAAGLHPIGRLGEPEEVAELILWLASPKSSFVTGSYYAVDGGYLAQ